MSKTKLLVLALAVVLVAGLATAQNTLMGTAGTPNRPPTFPEGTEVLFRGDLGAEIGIGCSNPAGTSGGPNDVAVQVTATTLAPPYSVTSVFYNLFTQISPNITGLSFVGWAGGASPGAEFDRVTGFPFSQGSNVMALPIGSFVVPSASFHFGFNQAQTNVGLRWGVDTGSASGDSFIRAPNCGLAAFGTLSAIGYPGNWVMSATIDDAVPVELQSYDIE